MQRLELAWVAVGDYDLGAFLQESEADGASEGTGATGDEGDDGGEACVHNQLTTEDTKVHEGKGRRKAGLNYQLQITQLQILFRPLFYAV